MTFEENVMCLAKQTIHLGFFCFSAAYKHADGKKIDGRRVLVDVERARTVKGWLPRRLGKHLLKSKIIKFNLRTCKNFSLFTFCY